MIHHHGLPPAPVPPAGGGAAPTVSALALQQLLRVAQELGADPDAIRADACVGGSHLAEGRIPIPVLHATWAAAVRHTGRPDLALVVAERHSPSDHGLLGFVAMTGGTLGQALAHLERFAGLWIDDPLLVLEPEGVVACRHRARPPPSVGARCVVEVCLAKVMSAARVLTQRMIVPYEVRFAHAAPEDPTPYERFFRCPVRFGASETSMLLPTTTLALSLPKADAELGAFLGGIAGRALAPQRPSAAARVREIVTGEIDVALPTLERIARTLSTTERTLRRRLEKEGTSYRRLVEEVRADLARRLVLAGEPLWEVAVRTGFADVTSFNRAFRRWNGLPPVAWRERGAARAG